jgi:nitroreductase
MAAMITKKYSHCGITVVGAALLAATMITSCNSGGRQSDLGNNSAITVLTHNFGAREYAPGTLQEGDLDKILDAGIHAPSAMNRQPWRFVVVRNSDTIARILPNVPTGGVLIVVASKGNASQDSRLALDAGLATENLYLAAQALGYGSRIYTGPVEAVNAGLKPELGLTENDDVVAVVRIGRLAPGLDANTQASPRNDPRDVVSYR